MLNTKITLIFYPHDLKISLRSSKYGLSYSLQDDWRSNRKITHKVIMDSPYLIPVLLDFGIKVTGFWKVVLVSRHFSVWYLQCQKIHEIHWMISETKTITFSNFVSHDTKSMILRKFWAWPPGVFEAVAEAILTWSQWNFQNLLIRYKK